MTDAPQVSVIIVNYDRWTLLQECLLALGAQTYRDMEIIVVDNGSSDNSAEHVKRFFPQTKAIVLERNVGFCEGNNHGIAIARGEFIALLNNDAAPDPRWLEELVKAARDHPEASFFASRVLRYDAPTLLDSAGDGIALAGTAYRRGHRQPASQYAREEFVFGASGSAAFYRRRLLQEVGLFDEDFFAVYEDADLSFRAQLAGYRCLYVPTAIVYHRGSGTIGTYSDFYVYQTQRNVEFFFLKNMPSPLCFLLLPHHLLYDLLGLLFFVLLERRGGAFLRAKRDAVRHLPRMLDKRLAIQAKRSMSVRYLLSLMERDWLFRTAREKLGQENSR